MSGRWRIVGQQNGGPEHISTIVLTQEEAMESLLMEAEMHRRFGWTVTLGHDDDGEVDVVICSKVVRRGVRITRAFRVREFDAMHDVHEEVQ